MRLFGILLAGILLFLSGCTGSSLGANVRGSGTGFAAMPLAARDSAQQDYRIGPLDTLNIAVFQEADISQRGLLVDASGNISMPLIGTVQASGCTVTELAKILEVKLAKRFYVNPQVTVSVESSVAQRVTVQGDVREPGIYQIQGPTTLLDTIALAKGETETAALREVLVIRYINGERTGAVFDVNRIRRGDDRDPPILGRDVVIVGHSSGKQVWQDILRAAPLLNVFAQF